MIKRLEAFKESLVKHRESPQFAPTKALRNFLDLLEECQKFLLNYKEATFAKKLFIASTGNKFARDLAELNTRITQSSSDFSLAVNIDNEINRQQDLADLKDMFTVNTEQILENLNEFSASVESKNLVISNINAQLDVIASYFKRNNNQSLSKIEIDSILSDRENLLNKTNEKFGLILCELAEVNSGVKSIDNKLDVFSNSIQTILTVEFGQLKQQKIFDRILTTGLLNYDSFSTIKLIGEGGFACVYYGKRGYDEVAVKVFEPNRKNQRLTQSQLEDIEKEYLVMAVLSEHSERIVYPYGYCHKPDASYIILELSIYGSVYDVLNRILDISLSIKIMWITQLIEGISFLHSKEYIHQDIKPQNALLFSGLNLKLTDFGTAQHLNPDKTRVTLNVIVGTEGYEDPEIKKTGKVSKESDIYSWTMTALQILYANKRDKLWTPEEFIEATLEKLNLPEGTVKDKLTLIFEHCSHDSRKKRYNAKYILDILLTKVWTDPEIQSLNHGTAVHTLESELDHIHKSTIYEPFQINESDISNDNITNHDQILSVNSSLKITTNELEAWFNQVPGLSDKRFEYSEKLISKRINTLDRVVRSLKSNQYQDVVSIFDSEFDIEDFLEQLVTEIRISPARSEEILKLLTNYNHEKNSSVIVNESENELFNLFHNIVELKERAIQYSDALKSRRINSINRLVNSLNSNIISVLDQVIQIFSDPLDLEDFLNELVKLNHISLTRKSEIVIKSVFYNQNSVNSSNLLSWLREISSLNTTADIYYERLSYVGINSIQSLVHSLNSSGGTLLDKTNGVFQDQHDFESISKKLVSEEKLSQLELTELIRKLGIKDIPNNPTLKKSPYLNNSIIVKSPEVDQTQNLLSRFQLIDKARSKLMATIQVLQVKSVTGVVSADLIALEKAIKSAEKIEAAENEFSELSYAKDAYKIFSKHCEILVSIRAAMANKDRKGLSEAIDAAENIDYSTDDVAKAKAMLKELEVLHRGLTIKVRDIQNDATLIAQTSNSNASGLMTEVDTDKGSTVALAISKPLSILNCEQVIVSPSKDLLNKFPLDTANHVLNSDGVLVKKGLSGTGGDTGLASNQLYYCGRRMNQCRCGKCDGQCGPTNGCPCNSCLKLVSSLIIRNSDGVLVKKGLSGTGGDTGLASNQLYYCGRRMNQCRCGKCDGQCGPTNGCPCNSCLKLVSSLIIRNSDGVLVKKGLLGTGGDTGLASNQLYYCGRRMNQCRCGKCDGQ
eukprot:gene18655-24400_t